MDSLCRARVRAHTHTHAFCENTIILCMVSGNSVLTRPGPTDGSVRPWHKGPSRGRITVYLGCFQFSVLPGKLASCRLPGLGDTVGSGRVLLEGLPKRANQTLVSAEAGVRSVSFRRGWLEVTSELARPAGERNTQSSIPGAPGRPGGGPFLELPLTEPVKQAELRAGTWAAGTPSGCSRR